MIGEAVKGRVSLWARFIAISKAWQGSVLLLLIWLSLKEFN